MLHRVVAYRKGIASRTLAPNHREPAPLQSDTGTLQVAESRRSAVVYAPARGNSFPLACLHYRKVYGIQCIFALEARWQTHAWSGPRRKRKGL